jgi:HAMP domain-containing protein
MKIRSRLLLLLLPTLTAFLMLIAFFFYFNWSREILDSFKARLRSIVIATTETINSDDIAWISENASDPNILQNPKYLAIRQKLIQLKKKLPIHNLFIVKIEPVKEGEYVLKDADNPENQIHQANDQENAYRQVFLLDVSQSDPKIANAPGDYDFSETQEHLIYFTKKAFVTPIYEARKTHERFMSAYAPIMNNKGEVLALLGADESTKIIDQKLSNTVLIIVLGALGTLLLLIITLFIIANLISKPVQALNKAALGIAAGDYESNIQLDGPREIVELANTLNTMSECLVENIDRLKEGSLVRERMYGEYECSLLLQHYMLQKVVDEFTNPHVRIRLISSSASKNQNGLLLQIEQDKDLRLSLIEAKNVGFAGLYDLNKKASLSIEELSDEYYIDCKLTDNYKKMHCDIHEMSSPLVWSVESNNYIQPKNQDYSLQNQDMIFLFNSGLVELFGTEAKVAAWFSKVLRHFAQDGLETIQIMLSNELDFISKKHGLKRNYQIISLQISIPESLPKA